MKEAELLKTYRILRRMTQKEVADKLKMTHSGYSKYERGERKITTKILFEVMEVLNIPFSAFEDDKEFLNQNYEFNFEERLHKLSQEIIEKKNEMSDIEKDRAAKLFKCQFDKIQDEKRIILENLKLDDFEETIKSLNIDFLFKK